MLLESRKEKEEFSSYQRVQLNGYLKIAAHRGSVHLPAPGGLVIMDNCSIVRSRNHSSLKIRQTLQMTSRQCCSKYDPRTGPAFLKAG